MGHRSCRRASCGRRCLCWNPSLKKTQRVVSHRPAASRAGHRGAGRAGIYSGYRQLREGEARAKLKAIGGHAGHTGRALRSPQLPRKQHAQPPGVDSRPQRGQRSMGSPPKLKEGASGGLHQCLLICSEGHWGSYLAPLPPSSENYCCDPLYPTWPYPRSAST